MGVEKNILDFAKASIGRAVCIQECPLGELPLYKL